ncbi:MAG TPA: class III extradiol dioxygenase family protein [Steroidobacteraceae bacterium]|nr:class III extradiol dioxygenase family protein [Steroidobacteraceae bacterium]
MATIVGCVCTSHVPAIGGALARGLEQDAYWQPFFAGFPPVREWLGRVKPDVAVVFYNDHGLNFFLDNLPTFAVGAATEYRNEDEGWGIPALGSYPGSPALSWHIIESLVAADFDPASCQRMLVDHAFSIPMRLLWPDRATMPAATVPIAINTVQHPLPSPRRCYRLGQTVGRAIASYPEDLKVLVVGTGGLSHQLDGARAGHINREFDLMCMDKLVHDPAALIHYTVDDLVDVAGSQGVELMMWMAARAALGPRARCIHSNYHVPISNTAAGLLALEATGSVELA